MKAILMDMLQANNDALVFFPCYFSCPSSFCSFRCLSLEPLLDLAVVRALGGRRMCIGASRLRA